LNANHIIERNNISISGNLDGPPLLMAHGFGCDQNMWRFMTPELEKNYKVILFDYVGSGKSLLSDYTAERYSALEGYAADIVDILTALELKDVSVIGHSVSSIIAAIAYLNKPALISNIVMVCPTPCFLNFPPDYNGGFEHEDLQELIGLMDKNYIGWANYLAPLVMGTANGAQLVGELSGSFCSTDPIIAKNFANATFFSDYRHILPDLSCPVLLIQSASDALANVNVGEYMEQQIAASRLEVIDAEGHCLHMTHPNEIMPSVLGFLSDNNGNI
jgi:sigma-B regulation protein RsbQ